MTDNEIIKALECCGNIVDSTCKGCVYHETYNASCVVRLMRDALYLINRQKAEIERLQKEKAKIHKLIPKMIKEAKSEAVKEFAERLKKSDVNTRMLYSSVVYELGEDDIDNLVEEMAGDSE